jgi:hypothetical protein
VPSVAHWNHFGTATIPKRPFLNAFMDKYRKQYRKSMSALVKNILRGRLGPDKAERNIGIRAVRDMKKIVEGWKYPPNAPATIARKGFNDPLIHTRHLLRNIKWKRE